VSSFFLTRFCFTKSFSPFLCYSFCLLLSSILLASSPWFLWCLWDFDKNSIEILSNFYGEYHVSKGVSMVVPSDSCGVSKGCLWDFLWVPMGVPWYCMIFLWCLFRMSMIFLLGSYEFLWDYILWDFCWIPV